MKYTANIITAIRILFSILLFFTKPLTYSFYFIYLICGLSDMLDGLVARKLHIESDFGARLDSIADVVFVIAAATRIFPVISVSKFIWIWVILIAVIKVMNVICGYICQKKMVMLHTIANKATGFALFLLPLTLGICNLNYSAIPVCVLAAFAAIQEGCLILTGKAFIQKENQG